MKPYHEELSTKAWSIWQHHILPKTFFVFGGKLDVCLADNRILYFFERSCNLSTNLPESSMPCSAYSQVGLISNKGGVRLFQVSQKDRLFHPFWEPSAYGGNLLMRAPFLHPRKKAFFSYSVWPIWDNTWTINWKESLLICFENCQGVPYFHRQSSNRMMNTFILVNIITTCKR